MQGAAGTGGRAGSWAAQAGEHRGDFAHRGRKEGSLEAPTIRVMQRNRIPSANAHPSPGRRSRAVCCGRGKCTAKEGSPGATRAVVPGLRHPGPGPGTEQVGGCGYPNGTGRGVRRHSRWGGERRKYQRGTHRKDKRYGFLVRWKGYRETGDMREPAVNQKRKRRRKKI